MSLVKCTGCGKEIVRSKTKTVNKYGTWGPKCKKCQKKPFKERSYIKRNIKRTKKRYHSDPEFRKSVIDRSSKRYWDKRKTSHITDEEALFLSYNHSYPVIVPGHVGTYEISTNTKIITFEEKKRIKGAVWLEKWKKRVFK